MIFIKPSVCALGQPLRKRSLASDRAYPKISRRRKGKRHHHGGDDCGLVVLGVDGTFRTIPTVGILRGKIFCSRPNHISCQAVNLIGVISLFISYWPPTTTRDAVSATIVAGG